MDINFFFTFSKLIKLFFSRNILTNAIVSHYYSYNLYVVRDAVYVVCGSEYSLMTFNIYANAGIYRMYLLYLHLSDDLRYMENKVRERERKML